MESKDALRAEESRAEKQKERERERKERERKKEREGERRKERGRERKAHVARRSGAAGLGDPGPVGLHCRV